jgi:hypothetical protein
MPYGTVQIHEKYNAFTTLALGYTAGAGSMTCVDASRLPTTMPFSLLVTQRIGGAARPFTVSAVVGNVLTVAIAEGQSNDLNFVPDDIVEQVVSADAHERLVGFAQNHQHTGTVDGLAVAHASLSGIGTGDHHAQAHAIGGADHTGTLAHTALSAIGTNSHAAIDTALATGVTNDATAAAHIAATAAHGATGAVVGTTNTQSLSGKTLTAPTIGSTDWANANHAHAAANSGGTVSHNDLASVSANQHHSQVHVIGGADHSGVLVAGNFPTAPGILTPAMVANQSANVGLFGPASGAAAAPTMRAIVAADLPLATAWTPAVGCVGQNISTPTFTVGAARVVQHGKLAWFWCNMTFTSAGTAGSTILFTIPAGLTLATAASFPCIGTFIYVDSGTANYVGAVQVQTTTQLAFIAHNNNGGIGLGPNFAIANGDVLSFTCQAELA